MECVTFRSYGHGDHDDDRAVKYRRTWYGDAAADVERHARERDPIAVMKRHLIELGELSQEDAALYPAEGKGAGEVTDKDFPERVVKHVGAGVAYAQAAPEPDAAEALQWVFKEGGR